VILTICDTLIAHVEWKYNGWFKSKSEFKATCTLNCTNVKVQVSARKQAPKWKIYMDTETSREHIPPQPNFLNSDAFKNSEKEP
jgi:hypothetical protein